MGRLQNKIAIVTGANSGMGLATDDSVRNITGGYFYKCKVAKSSRRSKDKELARRLYEFTEKLIDQGIIKETVND